MIQDLVNGLFELVGSVLVWINVYKLYQDKEVKGVYWPITFFWGAWGLWNLYYYPFLDQWLSFVGGLIMAVGNTAWVVLAYYYALKKGRVSYET